MVREVQKRISGKAYRVLFTDLYSSEALIETVFGYDAQSFLMALSRFVSLRGWPEKIFSDSGTQLGDTDKEISKCWRALDQNAVYKEKITKTTQWIFRPADSPCHRGAVESLVKAAKKCSKMTMGTQRLSATKILTLTY